MSDVSNDWGDGITEVATIVVNDDGTHWYNGFDVTSIYDRNERMRYVYPASVLEDFFHQVRSDGGIMVRFGDEVVGEVKKFGRNLRGEHPNIIRLGIQFSEGVNALPEHTHIVIRPIVEGTFQGNYDPESGYAVTEVNIIKGFVIAFGNNEIPTIGATQ